MGGDQESEQGPTFDVIEQSFRRVQDKIAFWLADFTGDKFHEDKWDYDKGPGGGITRVWTDGKVIEKAGVNFSCITGGELPSSAATAFKIPPGTPFKATGVSLVIHPRNPYAATTHMNIRYFEAGDVWWFGGGVDLTPNYPELSDVQDFHRRVRQVCEESGEDYHTHKVYCDDYFLLKHRNETRGVGGIFCDHMKTDKSKHFNFVLNLGNAFNSIYLPQLQDNIHKHYGDRERHYQLVRRSRYAEFNLIYDRGTKFGLQSSGRIESILMSLPAVCVWEYNWSPEKGSTEEVVQTFYLHPQDWLADDIVAPVATNTPPKSLPCALVKTHTQALSCAGGSKWFAAGLLLGLGVGVLARRR